MNLIKEYDNVNLNIICNYIVLLSNFLGEFDFYWDYIGIISDCKEAFISNHGCK